MLLLKPVIFLGYLKQLDIIVVIICFMSELSRKERTKIVIKNSRVEYLNRKKKKKILSSINIRIIKRNKKYDLRKTFQSLT